MSAMAAMSRAIRLECEKHGPRIPDIPDAVLIDFRDIVGAFYFDLEDEVERRGLKPGRAS